MKQNTEQLKKEFDEKFTALSNGVILKNPMGKTQLNQEVGGAEEIWDFFLPHLISSDEIEHKCRINLISCEENGIVWDECKVCGKKWYPSEQEQDKHDKTTPSYDEIKREAVEKVTNDRFIPNGVGRIIDDHRDIEECLLELRSLLTSGDPRDYYKAKKLIKLARKGQLKGR